jgi:hypothetical protein
MDWHKEMFAHFLGCWTRHAAFKYMPRWPSPGDLWQPYPASKGDDPSALSVRLTIADMPYAAWSLNDYRLSTEEHWAEFGLGRLPTAWYLPGEVPLRRRARPSHLFNLLLTQMVAVLTSSKGLQECSICGSPFQVRFRRPQKRRKNGDREVDRRILCGKVSCATLAARERAAKAYDARRVRGAPEQPTE